LGIAACAIATFAFPIVADIFCVLGALLTLLTLVPDRRKSET
jgi:hypothetical protein